MRPHYNLRYHSKRWFKDGRDDDQKIEEKIKSIITT